MLSGEYIYRGRRLAAKTPLGQSFQALSSFCSGVADLSTVESFPHLFVRPSSNRASECISADYTSPTDKAI